MNFQEGAFHVPMRAVLPDFDVAVPDHINFNMCAAQDSVQLTFEIRNVRYSLINID